MYVIKNNYHYLLINNDNSLANNTKNAFLGKIIEYNSLNDPAFSGIPTDKSVSDESARSDTNL